MLEMLLFLLTLRVIPTVLSQKMSPEVLQDLMTPMKELGEACGYESCPAEEEGFLNVHIVPHSHGELGYARTFDEYFSGKIDNLLQHRKANWKAILDSTITELWRSERRIFTLSDIAFLFHWWWKRDGTVQRMVYQLIRQGRLHVAGGGWSLPDEACTSYHAIIDQFTHSFRKLNKTFGPCARPLVGWQSEAFGHSREFANLASMLGYDGLFISPISYEDELQRMVRKELEMLWRGSDDLGQVSDMFTHKLFDGFRSPPGFCFGSFCNDTLIITSDSLFNNAEERVTAFIDAAKNRQGHSYSTNHILVVMGERMGYFDAQMWFNNIDSLIFKGNEKSLRDGDKVLMFYSSPACYLKAVYDSSPSLPIKQDDFMPITSDKNTHMTGMFTSRPTIKYMVREGHAFLQMAKQLHVLAGLPSYVTKHYDDLSWVMGIFQDHNIITGQMRGRVKDYYTFQMYKALQKSTLLLKNAFNKLRNSPTSTYYYRCDFNISSCRVTNAKRSFVVIYNPLAWPVTVPVRLPVVRHMRHVVFNPKLQTVKSVSMKMSAAVLSIPHRNTKADHELIFIAENLPPMGYRSYYIESSTVAKPRKKRSIIKKLSKMKEKMYLSRQTDQMKIDDASMLDSVDNVYDEMMDEPGLLPDYSSSNDTVDDNNPFFEMPTEPLRVQTAEIDETKVQEHRGLFGKVTPFRRTQQDENWLITENPKLANKNKTISNTTEKRKEDSKKYLVKALEKTVEKGDIKKHYDKPSEIITKKQNETSNKQFDKSPKRTTKKPELDSKKDFDKSLKSTTNKQFDKSPKRTTKKPEVSPKKDFDQSPKNTSGIQYNVSPLKTTEKPGSKVDFDESLQSTTYKHKEHYEDYDESPDNTEKQELDYKEVYDKSPKGNQNLLFPERPKEDPKRIKEEDRKPAAKNNSMKLFSNFPHLNTVQDYLRQNWSQFFKPTNLQNNETYPRIPTRTKPDYAYQYLKSKKGHDDKYKLTKTKPYFHDGFFSKTVTEKYFETTDKYENTTKAKVASFWNDLPHLNVQLHSSSPSEGIDRTEVPTSSNRQDSKTLNFETDDSKILHNENEDSKTLDSEKEDSMFLNPDKEDSKPLEHVPGDSYFGSLTTAEPADSSTDEHSFRSMFNAVNGDNVLPSQSTSISDNQQPEQFEAQFPSDDDDSGFFGYRSKVKPKAHNTDDYEDTRRLFEKSYKRVFVTTTTAKTTTPEYDPLDDPNFNEDKNYFYRVSRDKFIKNKYVKVHLDEKNQVSRVTLSNGVEVALTIGFYYYASDDPQKLRRRAEVSPGAHVFKPMDPIPILIQDFVRSVVHKTYLVEEVQYTLSSWVGFVLRVYRDRPLVEVDWVVGPIPIDDDIGKDVFVRYSTDLATEGVLYTDSNGRQTMKRVRNSRPTYEPLLANIPSNFYPVTSKIYIEDPKKNIRFSVLNDRSQGGTSLHDGEIDLMIHRRILTEDGLRAYLNDTEYGQGIVVRGKHVIYISKADYKPNKIFEKKLAKEIELAPQILACPHVVYGDNVKEIWYGHNNEFKGVLKKLPAGIHVLTLQEWNDNTILLRLENYFEKSDIIKSGVKTVFIKDLFANIVINSVRETTLGGNVWMEDRFPMQWNTKEKFVKNFNEFYKGKGNVEYSKEDARDREVANITSGITLTPQQIRTFVVSYQFRS